LMHFHGAALANTDESNKSYPLASSGFASF
jgi:hypothetical protein